MSATPTDKHCIEWCRGCVEWCSKLQHAHIFTLQLLRRHPSAWNCAANIQQFFELTKHYDKNLKIFADLGDFLGRIVLSR